MTASIIDTEKAKMEKVLESVAKTVAKCAKKFNQPIIVVEDGKIKAIYPHKR